MMIRAVSYTFALALACAPYSARADAFGCLAGPSDLHRCDISGAPAAALAAIAAPVLVAGAAVSIVHELTRHDERNLDDRATTPADHKTPATLALVPTPPDPYRAPAGAKETRRKPNRAFEFNDKATNIATAVTGAMVLGAIIATVAKDAHSSGHK